MTIYHHQLFNFKRFLGVDPPLNTKDSKDLLNALDKIDIKGGLDCPEVALSGIKDALKYALPNSIGELNR